MSRKTLALGASVLALTLASLSYAEAQSTLPTINVGGNKARRVAGKPSANPNSGRTTAAPMITTMTAGQGVAGVGVPGLPDRYAEAKPAPFSRSLPANIPAVVVSRNRAEIENSVNMLTSAEAFKYLPSIYVRERYIGDTNAIISGRTSGTIESANTMLYSDGVLLSNYIGNGFAYPPRWGMVSPEEIDRIDVIYGPFSALYPGNSVGGVLSIHTRMPDSREVHIRGMGSAQTYSYLGYKNTPLSGNFNVLVGDKFGDGFRIFTTWNHLDSTSQPMTFGGNALQATRTGSFPNPNTEGPQFFGGAYQANSYGYNALYTAATGIAHTVQDLGKIKMSYDVDKETRVYYQAGFWNNMVDTNVKSFISDKNGVPIYNTQSGDVQFWATNNPNNGGISATPGGVNPGHAGSQHLMQSIQFKRDSGKEFDYEATVSTYNYLRDFSNSTLAYGMLPNNTLTNATSAEGNRGSSRVPYLINPTGQNTMLDGTYWRNGDIRAIYRPDYNLQGKHELSFGTHSDIYSLNQMQTQTSFWPSNVYMGVRQFNTGKTTMQSLYGQDAWEITDKLKFIGGVRGDWWNATNGSNAAGGWGISNSSAAGNVGPLVNVSTMNTATLATFPNSTKGGFQPKASVEYKVTKEYEVRASMGRAYRFPTVTELFQSLSTPNSVAINNPNLQPQVSTAYDFTQSVRIVDAFNGAVGLLTPRVSLFYEDRWNAIVNQSTLSYSGQVATQNLNVNKARFRGIEAELNMKDVLIQGLGFSGNVTFTDAQILNNNTVISGNQVIPLWTTAYPASFGGGLVNGNKYINIPPVKMKSVITYSPFKELEMAVAATYFAGAYATLGNIDNNHDTYMGTSQIIQFDYKMNYQFEKNWKATFGINNIGNYKSYVFHPNPQRSFFAGIQYDFGGPENSLQAGAQNPTQSWQ
jgi:iron complex outermembrane receptor protein